MLYEELGFKIVSARWVPKMLTANQKHIHHVTAKINLAIMNRDADDFLQKFVTVGEAWVYHFGSESKRENMYWGEGAASR